MSEMLHLVNKSPFDRPALQSCLRLAKAGGSLLLLEDGVYAATKGTTFSTLIEDKVNELNIYVLEPDFKARGLDESQLITGITTVDYSGFVDLVTEHDVSQSWL